MVGGATLGDGALWPLVGKQPPVDRYLARSDRRDGVAREHRGCSRRVRSPAPGGVRHGFGYVGQWEQATGGAREFEYGR